MAQLGEVVHVGLNHLSLSPLQNGFGCYFIFNINIKLPSVS